MWHRQRDGCESGWSQTTERQHGVERGDRGALDLRLRLKEEALAEAPSFTGLRLAHWPKWEGEIEIRRMYEAEDDVRETQIEGSRELERAGGTRQQAV